jgi:hypothetical protein
MNKCKKELCTVGFRMGLVAGGVVRLLVACSSGLCLHGALEVRAKYGGGDL